MNDDLSHKRSRETSHPDNPHSRQSADTTKLQRLRHDQTRFTRNSRDKAIMTPRMEMKEYKQQREAHLQAQEELKMLAERKGFTSGEIVLGTRVPRRYQKGLGGGYKEAEAYLQKHVKSRLDQQLVRDVVQGTKDETRVPIQKAAQKYKEFLGNDANPSQSHKQVNDRDTTRSHYLGIERNKAELYLSGLHEQWVREIDTKRENSNYKIKDKTAQGHYNEYIRLLGNEPNPYQRKS